MQLDAKVEAFWKSYLASLPEAKAAIRRFYEVFRIGNTPEGADEGAALIRHGVKTVTSSLLWVYEAANKPLPEVGSLSIVTDGEGNPEAAFAYDYGEWDRTLETWRARGGSSMRHAATP